MSAFSRVFSAAILLAMLLTAAPASSFGQSGSQPNILMVIIDDLNDYQEYLTDAIGGLETPNMNKLARNGTIFHNAHCSAPKSCPSRTSFMSGKDPDYTGVYNNENIQFIWRDNFRVSGKDSTVFSMPEAVKDAGYYTLGINKVYFGWKNEDYDNDYDVDNPDPCTRGLSFSDNIVIPPDQSAIDYEDEGIPGYIWAPTPDSTEPLMFDVMAADTAIHFLNDYAANPGNYCNRPFMMQLGLFLPHKPLVLPDKYFASDYVKPDEWYDLPFNRAYNDPPNAFPPNGVIMPPQPEPMWADYYALGDIGQDLARGGNNHSRFLDYPDDISPKPIIDSTLSTAEVDFVIAESKRANAVAAYKAAVKFIDYHAGRVLDVLESHPELAQNTVVIFMSDHGYSLGEKTHWHKFALWETDNRVPVVIMDPRKALNQDVHMPVSLVDIFPTVVDLAGGDEPTFPDGSRYLDGQSLVPFLDNPNLRRERPTPTSLRKPFGSSDCFVQYSVRSEKFHYLKYRSPIPGVASDPCDTPNTFFEEELYHLGTLRDADPNEWTNLADDPKYANVKEWISQFLADSALFYVIPPYIEIVEPEPLPCSFNYETDTVALGFDFWDPSGVQWSNIPPAWTLRWEASTDPGNYNSSKNFIVPVADLMDSATFASGEDLLIYVEVVDTTGLIAAQDVIVLNLNEDYAPDLSYSVSVDGNIVSVDNPVYSNEDKLREVIWSWGDGTETVGEMYPAPHKYAAPGDYQIKAFLTFGNDTSNLCSKGVSEDITIDAVDFNEGVCMAPINLHLRALAANKAKIRWNDVYGAIAYQLRARKLTGPDSAWITISVPSSTVAPGSLQPDQEYEVQVRTICDVALGFTSVSDWSYPLRFTTKQCSPPRNVQVDSVTETTATISWVETQTDAAGNYNLSYGQTGTSLITIPATGSGTTLTGLDSASLYYMKVRSRCPTLTGGTLFSGPFSELVTWTTLGGIPRIAAFDPSLGVYPNPAVNSYQLRWNAEIQSEARVVITDIFGRVMADMFTSEAEGFNTLKFNSEEYASGMYQATLVQGENRWTKSFVVER